MGELLTSALSVLATATDEGVEFDLGTLLYVVAGFVALIAVCMIGPVARLMEHRAERKAEERAAAQRAADEPADS